MMMPESKYLHFSVVLSSILVLSACSLPEFMKVDSVDDTVAYQKSANSVRSLSIPPGLSNPGFDSTYSSVRGSGNTSAARPSVAPPSNLMAVDSAPAMSGGSSLGSALMAQSGTGSVGGVQQTRSAPTPNMPQVAMIRLKGGEPAMAINASSDGAWKSLAYALPAAGFRVSKQQQSQGIITTTYQGDNATLGKGKTYLILMAENASKQPFVGVAGSSGKPAGEAIANAALTLLKAQFEK